MNSHIFGIRPVIEAIKEGKEIDKILVKNGLQGELYSELFALIKQKNLVYQYVPIEKLDRITRKNHQGIIAYLAEATYYDIEQIVPFLFEQGKTPVLLVLDSITDVRNFGAIARTVECAGIHAIVIPESNSVSINADAVKTSAGALLKIPVCRQKSLKTAVHFMKNSGIQIVAATEKTSDNYTKADFTTPVAIVMGSEDQGINSEILKLADHKVKIPILGTIESLNVSVAAGVLMYEVVRQRSNA